MEVTMVINDKENLIAIDSRWKDFEFNPNDIKVLSINNFISGFRHNSNFFNYFYYILYKKTKKK